MNAAAAYLISACEHSCLRLKHKSRCKAALLIMIEAQTTIIYQRGLWRQGRIPQETVKSLHAAQIDLGERQEHSHLIIVSRWDFCVAIGKAVCRGRQMPRMHPLVPGLAGDMAHPSGRRCVDGSSKRFVDRRAKVEFLWQRVLSAHTGAQRIVYRQAVLQAQAALVIGEPEV